MPSCPEALDGRVEVHVGEGVTANMSLLNSDGVVLDQLIGVEEVAEFVSVAPGDYSVIVTGTAGTTCPKSQREGSVPPGEGPGLLGLSIQGERRQQSGEHDPGAGRHARDRSAADRARLMRATTTPTTSRTRSSPRGRR